MFFNQLQKYFFLIIKLKGKERGANILTFLWSLRVNVLCSFPSSSAVQPTALWCFVALAQVPQYPKLNSIPCDYIFQRSLPIPALSDHFQSDSRPIHFETIPMQPLCPPIVFSIQGVRQSTHRSCKIRCLTIESKYENVCLQVTVIPSINFLSIFMYLALETIQFVLIIETLLKFIKTSFIKISTK